MSNQSKIFLLLAAALLLCSDGYAGDPSKPVVFVSILPQAFFVEQIAGDAVDIEVLIGPGESPATFDPPPRRMARLAGARALLVIGVPMEHSLLPDLATAMPDLPVFPVQTGIDLLPATAHSHGPDEHHETGESADAVASELDSHVWMDPVNALTIAENTYRALAQVMPADSTAMRLRLVDLQRELARLDRDMAAILAPVRGRVLAVFHPAYGYLARRYGLQQLAIETDGMAPSPRSLARILHRIEDEHAGAIFVQPQFSSTQAESLAKATGVPVRVLDPLARDYGVNMRAIAREIAAALQPEAAR